MCFMFSVKLVERDDNKIIIEFQGNKIAIQTSPFRIDVISGNEPVVSVNSRGLLHFEHLRVKT
jgi:alpha 1,3-glucosidase